MSRTCRSKQRSREGVGGEAGEGKMCATAQPSTAALGSPCQPQIKKTKKRTKAATSIVGAGTAAAFAGRALGGAAAAAASAGSAELAKPLQ